MDASTKKITAIYSLLALATLASFVPTLAFVYLSLFLFVATIVTAYVFRAEDPDADSLKTHHMTYIIRTIWIMSLFSVVTIGLACAYMIPQIDYAAMQDCTMAVSGAITPDNPDYEAMNAMMQPCMDEFFTQNKMTFAVALAIAGGPVMLYLLWRLFKGFRALRRGEKIARLTAWF